jgi:hypothetical protein
MNSFMPLRLFGDRAGAERAQRVTGFVDVKRLAREQAAAAVRAIGGRMVGMQAADLDFGRDVEPCETHAAGFAEVSSIPSGGRSCPPPTPYVTR